MLVIQRHCVHHNMHQAFAHITHPLSSNTNQGPWLPILPKLVHLEACTSRLDSKQQLEGTQDWLATGSQELGYTSLFLSWQAAYTAFLLSSKAHVSSASCLASASRSFLFSVPLSSAHLSWARAWVTLSCTTASGIFQVAINRSCWSALSSDKTVATQ